jgi:hypothetical protein
MKRGIWIMFLLLVPGCESGEGGVPFTVMGRVAASMDADAGLPGVEINCPVTGRKATTGADGTFAISGSLVEAEDGTIPTVALWFSKEGLADTFRTVRVVEEVRDYAVHVVMSKESSTQNVALPVTSNPARIEVDNASFYFGPGSLVDEAGEPATGNVPVTLAVWDPSVPSEPDASPPRLDSLWPPFSAVSRTLDDTTPYLRPLVALRLDAGTLAPDPVNGVGVELLSTFADAAFGGADSSDNRLFRVDDKTGVLIEGKPGRVDRRNTLAGSVSESGTWLWAKAIRNPSCITVTVRIGDRPFPGAQVRLTDVAVDGTDQTLMDQQVGSRTGEFCLQGSGGRLVRAEAWVGDGNGVRSRSGTTLMSLGGDCATGCPGSIDLVFPCLSNDDCENGALCIDDICQVPEEI